MKTPRTFDPDTLAWFVATHLTAAPKPAAPKPAPEPTKPTTSAAVIAVPPHEQLSNDAAVVWAALNSVDHPQHKMLAAIVAGDGSEYLNGDKSKSAEILSFCDKAAYAAAARGIAPTVELIAAVVGRTVLALHPKWQRENWRRNTIEKAIKYVTERAKVIPIVAPRNESRRLVVENCGDMRPEPILWTVPGVIPRGCLTLWAAPGGMAKSLIGYDVAACLSRGVCAFGMTYADPAEGCTLIFNCEDHSHSVILPRLLAAGADVPKIDIVKGAVDADGKTNAFTVDDLPQLCEQLKTRPYKLLIIDPIASLVAGAGLDEHKDGEVRTVLEQLAKIAADFNLAIVLVKHLNKSGKVSAVDRVSGSTAYVNSARVASTMGETTAFPEGTRAMVHIKANIVARANEGILYKVVELERPKAMAALAGVTGLTDDEKTGIGAQMIRIEWLGKAVIDPNALNQPKPRDAKPSRTDAAVDALVKALGEHAWPVKELDAGLVAGGMAGAALRAAKERLSALPDDHPQHLSRVQTCEGKSREWWCWIGPEGAMKPARIL